MPGLTNAESAATLDARFPTSGGTDYVAYSENGTSESAKVGRHAVGASGWAAATVADPSVKANAVGLSSPAATTAGTISHFAIFSASSGGTQRTEWKTITKDGVDAPKTVAIGDSITWAVGKLQVTLT
ncbi:MAG TPA: hypothetical protein VFL73_10995 [Solirubrobacteraceae bacterium]|nr:hypothetical protein [Solirubrobacteraceae bacterium]